MTANIRKILNVKKNTLNYVYLNDYDNEDYWFKNIIKESNQL